MRHSQGVCFHREGEDLKQFPKHLRQSLSARMLALALLALMPFNGAYPQTASDSNTTATPAQPADAGQAPAPATPAAPADASQPVTSGDMSTPGGAAAPAPADQGAPAVPADQGAASTAPADQAPATSGHRNRKLVTAPDEAAPGEGEQGPIVREINIEYIGPKTVAKSVILSNMRTTVGEVYSAASVEEDIRNLYATGFFTNLRDQGRADGRRRARQRRRPAQAAGEGNRHQRREEDQDGAAQEGDQVEDRRTAERAAGFPRTPTRSRTTTWARATTRCRSATRSTPTRSSAARW